ncbi:methyltransferase type 12 [Sphaerisporangium krabiense]|uniref:SAM-dependent methyltransferase n=1 Tax=Sphaerisporangium krabiense TaxID=763782 RepID=A0A7W8Z9E4_9ACTN|nr:methyltransferase domain-containing protein [Sphaerisporangium krabiense]MBB5629854.1 SAM-dependent methyltransferase [Sphaerisporangium krabiense]GII63955.1 methyltransferase type 12 [Sphaerisporangium krabiense]
MIGELYADALAGAPAEVEHADGARRPLPAGNWFHLGDGDEALLSRCASPTLDIGSGPGRLTAALARRGVRALGIDVTPHAVALTRMLGGRALVRDVFGDLPGAGRWATALLADGNIGIGGDPGALLRRVRQLVRPGGVVLADVEPPEVASRVDLVRLRRGELTGPWFSWATVSASDVSRLARAGGFPESDCWSSHGRWFARMR